MKKLIFARHAAYGNPPLSETNPHISKEGHNQALFLGMKIDEEVKDFHTSNIELWSSTAYRAQETAEVVKSMLSLKIRDSIEIQLKEKLWSDNWHQYDFEWLMSEIRNSKADVIIIISHLEYVNDFPRMHLLNPHRDMYNCTYATGIVIDFDGKGLVENFKLL